MAQISVGKLLPNIKVTLGNDQVNSDVSDITDIAPDSDVNVVRPIIDNLIHPKKLYINRAGGFTTGIDLLAQEKTDILSKRASRFGLEIESKPTISSLYKSMEIDLNNRNSSQMKKIRLDTIHVRGVEGLHTDDVFHFFQDYGPVSIEWINDKSCNITWDDEVSCARALLGLSKPLPSNLDPKIIKTMENSKKSASLESLEKNMEVDSTESDVDVSVPPVPPGRWRIAIQRSKSRTLLLRFAVKGDKKVRGANKQSEFYKKYGNPNYGGLKGYISESWRRKSHSQANRWAVERESRSSIPGHQSSSLFQQMNSKPKKLKMKMYADEEELKAKEWRSKRSGHMKGDVHSRLGAKFTYDELCRLGNYKDYDKHYDESAELYHKPRRSSDLRAKLKNLRSQRKIESTPGPSSCHTITREQAFDSVKNSKNERSYFKRKHVSPLLKSADDDDDDDDDDEETTEDDY